MYHTVFILALGAVIGYVTNFVAIKMLFRPRNPIYIAGFRLPFTPGLIPAEKSRIARNIGKSMTQLLSPDSLRDRLLDEKVLESLYESLNTIFNGSFILAMVPQGVRLSVFERIIEAGINHFPAILKEIDLESTTEQQLNTYSDRELETLVLSVARRELRSITWFGAILGMLIATIQLLIL